MGFDDEAPVAVPGIKKVYVKLMYMNLNGRNADLLVWEAQIRILANIPATAPQAQAIEDARNITQMIAMDFDARIRWEFEDRDEDSRCYFITSIGEPTFSPVGLVDQNAIGWDYFFRFQTDRPGYDAAKWTE